MIDFPDKESRIAYRVERTHRLLYMKDHLEEMSTLLGTVVEAGDLIPMNAIGERLKAALKEAPAGVYRAILDFDDRKGTRFLSYIGRLSLCSSEPVYVFSQHSTYCGILKIANLTSVDFSFPFDLNGGILSFLLETGTDRLVLDWNENHYTSKQTLEIEAKGKLWSQVEY